MPYFTERDAEQAAALKQSIRWHMATIAQLSESHLSPDTLEQLHVVSNDLRRDTHRLMDLM
jgi:hypothetical protein